MNLATTHQDYEFLTKTKYGTPQSVIDFVYDVYQDSIVHNPYDCSTPDYLDLIPTRFMILTEARTHLEYLYYYYALNGHCSQAKYDIDNHNHEEDMSDVYGENDIVEKWRDWSSYNEGFCFGTDKERMFFRDINKVLSTFNICFINDDSGEDIYSIKSSLTTSGIVNSPIVEVW